MNIFFLDKDPEQAAIMQCDQHVVKMPLETAQMLCAAFPEGKAPYKRTHYNHPSTIWARSSQDNFCWLILHGLSLCEEYTFRYGKEHQSQCVIFWCWSHIYELSFNQKRLTPIPLTMPDDFKMDDPVLSYRMFYSEEKSKFAKWTKTRLAPTWYQLSLNNTYN